MNYTNCFLKLLFKGTLFFLVSACKQNDYSELKSEIDQDGSNVSPNILLIIADDMGIDATSGYRLGSIKPNMPTLMQLQAEGVTYDNVWSTPMCAPTRATIITGRYGINNGVLNTTNFGTLPETEKTIQTYLDQELGKKYSNALIGKWHLSNNEVNRPNEMGIDYFAGLIPGTISDYNQWELTINGNTTTSYEYITTRLTDLAIDWINVQDKPWFCWLAYTAPHSPFHFPPAEMHSQNSLSDDTLSLEINPRTFYMAMIESLDYEIGRLLNQIPTEVRKNTVIIFMGDNGTPGRVIQSPFLSNQSKGSLFQGGIHVPLVVSGQGVTRSGKRDKSLINTVDLFSTIAQIAGVKNPQYYDSQSFYTTFSDDSPSLREFNYSEILDFQKPAKSGYTIRNEHHKLIVLNNGNSLFYNLIADPYEQDNLMNKNLSPEEQLALEELQAEVSSIR